MSVTINHK